MKTATSSTLASTKKNRFLQYVKQRPLGFLLMVTVLIVGAGIGLRSTSAATDERDVVKTGCLTSDGISSAAECYAVAQNNFPDARALYDSLGFNSLASYTDGKVCQTIDGTKDVIVRGGVIVGVTALSFGRSAGSNQGTREAGGTTFYYGTVNQRFGSLNCIAAWVSPDGLKAILKECGNPVTASAPAVPSMAVPECPSPQVYKQLGNPLTDPGNAWGCVTPTTTPPPTDVDLCPNGPDGVQTAYPYPNNSCTPPPPPPVGTQPQGSVVCEGSNHRISWTAYTGSLQIFVDGTATDIGPGASGSAGSTTLGAGAGHIYAFVWNGTQISSGSAGSCVAPPVVNPPVTTVGAFSAACFGMYVDSAIKQIPNSTFNFQANYQISGNYSNLVFHWVLDGVEVGTSTGLTFSYNSTSSGAHRMQVYITYLYDGWLDSRTYVTDQCSASFSTQPAPPAPTYWCAGLTLSSYGVTVGESVVASPTGFGANGGSVSAWSINWGNGTTNALTSNTYATAGTYTVTATPTSGTGSLDPSKPASCSTSVTVRSNAVAVTCVRLDISPATTVNVNTPVTVAGQTTNNAKVTGWTINWGDGAITNNTQAGDGVTHSYVAGGAYTITETFTYDNSAGGSGTNTCVGSITVNKPTPVISITKTSTYDKMVVGQEFEYTIIVKNEGPTTLQQVTISDTQPEGVQFIDPVSPATIRPRMPVGGLLVGQTTTTTIRAKVTSPTPGINTAKATALDVNGTPTAEVSDPDPIEVLSPNHTVKKYVRKAGTSVWFDAQSDANSIYTLTNDEVEYKIVYANTGNAVLDSYVVKDVLPSGVTYASGLSVTGVTSPSPTLYFGAGINAGRLDVGKTIEVLFKAKLPGNAPAVSHLNTASGNPGGIYLPNGRGGTSGETTPFILVEGVEIPAGTPGLEEKTDPAHVKVLDHSVSKLVCPKSDPAAGCVKTYISNLGEEVTYKVTYTNTGNVDLPGYIATDLLPAGFSYSGNMKVDGTAITGENAYFLPGGVGLELGPIAAGTSKVVTFNVRVVLNNNDALLAYDNVAYGDPAVVSPPAGATEGGSSATPTPIDLPKKEDAAKVLIRDFNVKKYVRVRDGTWEDADSAAVLVPTGKTLEYRIDVVNTGDIDLANVNVKDALPAGISYIDESMRIPQDNRSVTGTEDNAMFTTGVNIGTVGVNQTKQVVFEVSSPAFSETLPICGDAQNLSFNNVAIVKPSSETPASVLANNPGATGSPVSEKNNNAKVEVCRPRPQPDVLITKDVSKANVMVGEEFIYTITVKNTGDQVLKNLTVSDPAPADVEFIKLVEGVNGVAVQVSPTLIGATINELTPVEQGKSTTSFKVSAKLKKYSKVSSVNVACVNAVEVSKVGTDGVKDSCDDAPVTPIEPCPYDPTMPNDPSNALCKPCPYNAQISSANEACKKAALPNNPNPSAPIVRTPDTGASPAVVAVSVATLAIGTYAILYTRGKKKDHGVTK